VPELEAAAQPYREGSLRAEVVPQNIYGADDRNEVVAVVPNVLPNVSVALSNTKALP
jgi:hypothetical protein